MTAATAGKIKIHLVRSKLGGRLLWKIQTPRELTPAEVSFIETFNPVVYFNDLECYEWAFDEKLPSGAWIENMRFKTLAGGLSIVEALIF